MILVLIDAQNDATSDIEEKVIDIPDFIPFRSQKARPIRRNFTHVRCDIRDPFYEKTDAISILMGVEEMESTMRIDGEGDVVVDIDGCFRSPSGSLVWAQ